MATAAAPSTLRERQNWLIHLLYVRHEFSECLRLIEKQLKACNGLCEFPIYVKGANCRVFGAVQETLLTLSWNVLPRGYHRPQR